MCCNLESAGAFETMVGGFLVEFRVSEKVSWLQWLSTGTRKSKLGVNSTNWVIYWLPVPSVKRFFADLTGKHTN